MKVICINNSCVEDTLTIGKEYELNVTADEWDAMDDTGLIALVNDYRDSVYYLKERFLAVDVYEEYDEDKVNHPSHYTQGQFEVIDVIEDWNLGFNLGNAVKYIGRAGHKDDIVQDLEKAKWYIEREIQRLKKNK